MRHWGYREMFEVTDIPILSNLIFPEFYLRNLRYENKCMIKKFILLRYLTNKLHREKVGYMKIIIKTKMPFALASCRLGQHSACGMRDHIVWEDHIVLSHSFSTLYITYFQMLYWALRKAGKPPRVNIWADTWAGLGSQGLPEDQYHISTGIGRPSSEHKVKGGTKKREKTSQVGFVPWPREKQMQNFTPRIFPI